MGRHVLLGIRNIDGSMCLSVHPCSCDPVCALHMCACFCVCTWVFIPSVHTGGTTVSQAHAHACMHAHTHTLADAGKSPSRHKPVFEAPDDFLEEDDSVGDGLVPLHLQQHVMVVLEGKAS